MSGGRHQRELPRLLVGAVIALAALYLLVRALGHG